MKRRDPNAPRQEIRTPNGSDLNEAARRLAAARAVFKNAGKRKKGKL